MTININCNITYEDISSDSNYLRTTIAVRLLIASSVKIISYYSSFGMKQVCTYCIRRQFQFINTVKQSFLKPQVKSFMTTI